MKIELQTCHHVVVMEKVAKHRISRKCSIYATVFKLYVILLVMEGMEK